jgi:hypothetical protein
MKGKSSIYIVTILFFSMLSLVLVSGCARPPQQEMDAANATIQSAVGAGAETYAADELKAAQDLIAQMNSQVEKKDYNAAKESAIKAQEKALEAKSAAEANKAKAKEEVTTASNDVKQGLEKTKGILTEAETAGVPAVDLNPIKEQLTAVETAAGELDGMVSGEKYKEAIEKTTQMKEQLTQIEQGITDAKAKFEAAKAAKKKGKKR